MHYVLVANTAFTVVNFRQEFIEALKANSGRVTVVCPRSCTLLGLDNVEPKLAEMSVQYAEICLSRNGINIFEDLTLLFQLRKILKKIGPDVVVNYTIKPTIYSSLAGWMAGVPFIASNITGLGHVFTNYTLRTRLLKKFVSILYRLSLSRNNIVFFQNKDDLLLFRTLKILKDTPAKVICGSGVNLTYFDGSDFASADKLPNSYIFIGRLLKDKGIYEFLEAAERAKATNSSLNFTVVGGSDDNPACIPMEYFDGYVERGIVEHLGVVDDVRPLLAKSEVLVLPSYREGTPRVVLEAMAMGLAIITTDAPGCRETVEDNRNGFLVEPKSVTSILDAIQRLASDPEARISMGKESLLIAHEKYDVDAVNRSIISEFPCA